mmetsp:Transcript_64155/g.137803  ORF Transcript_64155/g.137803 Transcript_64155/m.137803 type:complete len:449 (-) Transcript_64155:40-1386(-)
MAGDRSCRDRDSMASEEVISGCPTSDIASGPAKGVKDDSSGSACVPSTSVAWATTDLLSKALAVVPDRLYWLALQPGASVPSDSEGVQWVCTDTSRRFRYDAFNFDFGPLTLGATYRYCKMLNTMLLDPALADRKIVHYCSSDPHRRENSIYLMCAYLVIVHRWPAEEAWNPFKRVEPPLVPFRDASRNIVSDFDLTVLDCLQGIELSCRLNLFDWQGFNVKLYEYFDIHGYLSWILPGKMLAFPNPSSKKDDADPLVWTPEDYAPLFKQAGVSLVIRLNSKSYEEHRFTDAGLKYVAMCFPDGSCPMPDIVSAFLDVTGREAGACAIHCKAGLGRTGTLIGLYAMKHYGFTARSFIGWSRICRPGSVVGPQQQWLANMQDVMFQQGALLSLKRGIVSLSDSEALLLQEMHRMGLAENRKAEDPGQGEKLSSTKQRFSALKRDHHVVA